MTWYWSWQMSWQRWPRVTRKCGVMIKTCTYVCCTHSILYNSILTPLCFSFLFCRLSFISPLLTSFYFFFSLDFLIFSVIYWFCIQCSLRDSHVRTVRCISIADVSASVLALAPSHSPSLSSLSSLLSSLHTFCLGRQYWHDCPLAIFSYLLPHLWFLTLYFLFIIIIIIQ